MPSVAGSLLFCGQPLSKPPKRAPVHLRRVRWTKLSTDEGASTPERESYSLNNFILLAWFTCILVYLLLLCSSNKKLLTQILTVESWRRVILGRNDICSYARSFSVNDMVVNYVISNFRMLSRLLL